MLDLNTALEELKELDPPKVQLVELRYFLGCTIEEAAEVMGISVATANRDLKFVRSWLFERIEASKSSATKETVSRFAPCFTLSILRESACQTRRHHALASSAKHLS